jgi:phosphatidylserine/phosphatidylglycerophosphate/cardiolipin synthase-like enzyme
MGQLRPETETALKVLARHSEVAAAICVAVADGVVSGTLDVRKLCTLSALSGGMAGAVTEFLEAARLLGLIEKSSELNWRIANVTQLASLAPMLQAIQLYRTEIHQDANSVQVVLTTPPEPSELAKRLGSMLKGTWGMHDTRGMLPALAEKANERFVVMTPFLDEYGADILVKMYENTACSKRILILRRKPNGQWPEGYVAEKARLKELSVEVYNFSLEKLAAAGNETFHAKVVLADRHCAYVGSANMNQWSFKYSLELGLMVSGSAAAQIADIVDAVISVSVPIP